MVGRVRRPHDKTEQEKRASGSAPVKRGLFLRVIVMLVLAALITFAGGFLWFAAGVLTRKPPAIYETDAVVVLTGGSRRIEAALALLEQGAGERLLISGVNPATTPESILQTVGGNPKLFECCVDVGYEALDTYGNAVETSKWIAEHGYSRVLVVTSAYHLPRGLYELRHIDPDTVFVGYPVSFSQANRNWYSGFGYARVLFSEYLKYIGAHVRAETGWKAIAPAGTDTGDA